MSSDSKGVASYDVRTWGAFLAAIVIGGANFVGVSYSNMTLPPLYGAAVRFAMAAVLFFGFAQLWRVELARGRDALGAAVYGLLAYGLTYACLYYALLGLSAGTLSVIVASAPLFTLGVAIALGQERLTGRGILGGALVIVGIGILSAEALAGGIGLPFLGAAIIGVMSIACSTVLARAIRHVHPVSMNAYGMTAGATLLALGSLAWGEPWSIPGDVQTWLALAWLVVLGSVGLFQLFLYVVKRWSASATVYAVAGMPVVAAALGAVMLDQPVTPQLLIGGALVVVAIRVGSGARAPATPGRPAPRAGR